MPSWSDRADVPSSHGDSVCQVASVPLPLITSFGAFGIALHLPPPVLPTSLHATHIATEEAQGRDRLLHHLRCCDHAGPPCFSRVRRLALPQLVPIVCLLLFLCRLEIRLRRLIVCHLIVNTPNDEVVDVSSHAAALTLVIS